MTDHPLFSKKKILLLWLFIWVIIIMMHCWWLISGGGKLISAALKDSFIYNLVFMILSIVMWFPMRAIYQTRGSTLTLAGGYLVLIGSIISIWLLASNGLVRILSDNQTTDNILLPIAPWRIITGFFYALVMILVYYLILYYEELREKTDKEAELRAMMAETEINALKAQLNPHFLFNTLNTMGSLIHTNPDQAGDMLISLSQFLRYSLRHEESSFVSLAQELEHINVYLELLRMRYRAKWNVEQKIEGSCTQNMIPVMILLPLVENAVQYAFGEQKDHGWIRLECSANDNEIIITVTNSYDPQSLSGNGHGIGLKNIQKRLQLHYGKTDLLEVIRKENIFEVRLHLPADTKPNDTR